MRTRCKNTLHITEIFHAGKCQKLINEAFYATAQLVIHKFWLSDAGTLDASDNKKW